MEKTISMNDVIAFIEKAMKNNLDINVMSNEGLRIYKSESEYITFWLLENVLAIDKPKYNNEYRIENISELDLSAYKYLCAKTKEYSINKALNYFNTFFEEIDSKPRNINDLNNEDD